MRVYYNEPKLDYFLDEAIENESAQIVITDAEISLNKMKNMILLIKDRKKLQVKIF